MGNELSFNRTKSSRPTTPKANSKPTTTKTNSKPTIPKTNSKPTTPKTGSKPRSRTPSISKIYGLKFRKTKENVDLFKIDLQSTIGVFDQKNFPSVSSPENIIRIKNSIKRASWKDEAKIKFIGFNIKDVMDIVRIMKDEGISRVSMALENVDISSDVTKLTVENKSSDENEYQMTAENVDAIQIQNCTFAAPKEEYNAAQRISDVLTPFRKLFPKLRNLHIKDKTINDINFSDLWIDRLLPSSYHNAVGQGLVVPEIMDYDVAKFTLYCQQLIPSLEAVNDIDLKTFGDLVKFNAKLYGIPDVSVLEQMNYEDIDDEIDPDFDIHTLMGNVFNDNRVTSLIEKIENKYKNNGKKLFKWDKSDDKVKKSEYIEEILNRYVVLALHRDSIAILTLMNRGEQIDENSDVLTVDEVTDTLEEIFQDEQFPRLVERNAQAGETRYMASLRIKVVKTRCTDFNSVIKPSTFTRFKGTVRKQYEQFNLGKNKGDSTAGANVTTTMTNTSAGASVTTGAGSAGVETTEESKEDKKMSETDSYSGCMDIVMCLSTKLLDASSDLAIEVSAKAVDHESSTHFKHKHDSQVTKYSFWEKWNECGHEASDKKEGLSHMLQKYGIRYVKKCIEYKSITFDDLCQFLTFNSDEKAIKSKKVIFEKMAKENFNNLEFYKLRAKEYRKQFMSGKLPDTLWLLKPGLVQKATFSNEKEKENLFHDFMEMNSLSNASNVIPGCFVLPIEVI